MDLGDRPGAASVSLMEPLGLDPVANPIGHIIDDPDVVDMADRGVIELGQGLRLTEEPGSQPIVAREIHPHADPAVEEVVSADEEDPFGGGGDQPLKAVSSSEPALGNRKEGGRVERGHSLPATTIVAPPRRFAV